MSGNTMRWVTPLAALSLVLGAVFPAFGGEFDLSGFVGGELRYFPESPAFPEQEDNAASPSALIQLELRYAWNGGDDRITFIPFYRVDADDASRTHADIRELHWLTLGDNWDLLTGIGKVFWGVAESRHLVDIVNQTDLVENPNQEDKLGQPMIRYVLVQDWGALSLLALPGFRERTFPDDDARLRGPLPIDTDHPEYESDDEERHTDFAARYSQVLGDFDLGLSYFQGTSREPLLIPRGQGNEVVLVPVYNQIAQTGIDLQATLDQWLLKLETVYQTGHGDPFLAAVGGFEYTVFGMFDGPADLGLLAEYLADGRDVGEAPFTPFEDDYFLAARLALNDEQNTSVLAGVIVDRGDGAALYTIEAERRLGSAFKLELESNFFTNTRESDPLHAFRRDGYVGLTLLAYF